MAVLKRSIGDTMIAILKFVLRALHLGNDTPTPR